MQNDIHGSTTIHKLFVRVNDRIVREFESKHLETFIAFSHYLAHLVEPAWMSLIFLVSHVMQADY